MKSLGHLLGRYRHSIVVQFFAFLIVALTCSLFALPANSADVTLAWDANTESDLAGYKLYYKQTYSGSPYNGTGAVEGCSPIDINLSEDENNDADIVQYTVHGLTENAVYFFAVTAYNDKGIESGYSNEVTTETGAPSFETSPTIDYVNNTIDVAYTEQNMQHATAEANYSFSPSVNFATPLEDGDDIIAISETTYRLNMASIPSFTIFTLTVTGITDTDGNPVTPDSITINDTDTDGMADDWEAYYGIDDPRQDSDGDGLTALEEYTYRTDPTSEDTDLDGMPDGWEVSYGLNPLIDDAAEDGDQDGWCNYEEYLAGTDPGDPNYTLVTSPPEIVETIPHQGAGLNGDTTRVPHDTSFSVRIEEPEGIDTTDPGSIVFTIDDGIHTPYTRDLSHDGQVRVVKLTDEQDTCLTTLWAAYDRTGDDEHGNSYPFDAVVTIQVEVRDRNGGLLEPAPAYSFKVESQTEHNDAFNMDSLPPASPVSPDDPDLDDPVYFYDAGIEVTSGALAGTKIIYNSGEPVIPRLGPTNEIPTLDGARSVPINLQPSTVFTTPVKLFIPYPDRKKVDNLHIYLYEAGRWVRACDNNGQVLPEGEGWMVPGSRLDHNDRTPPAIEIKVYHFSGVQVLLEDTSSDPVSDALPNISDIAEEGTGCFIGTMSFFK